jgi:ubiquinone/menaquinone biosynthesis C-methylase UbiE
VKTEKQYKDLTIREFTKAADIYESSHAGIYEMCKDDYPYISGELAKEDYTDLLDCGCGTGPMISLLYEEDPTRHYTGIDITPRMIEVARAKELPGVTWVVGDCENLPFEDDAFDAVICSNSFHHYPNPQKFFDSVQRVLRPGGRLILQDYTAPGPVLWLMNHTEMPLANLIGHGDVGAYSLDEVRGFCGKSGLRVEKLERGKKFRLHLVARKGPVPEPQRNDSLTRKEQIKNAYKLTGSKSGFYDGMMTYSTLPGKAICRLVWNMDGQKNLRYLEKALSGVPQDFEGKLLEVPVGTGVLTMPVYADLPKADITCLDYSEKMMASARDKAETMGITNIKFVQGDVGALPFEDESFDVVLSLNGFHAFPDKEAAYRETYRVLKKGGIFCGCFYIKGECGRTDWFIDHLYGPKGFFTPPYETRESLRRQLEQRYEKVKVTAVEGIGCFRCRK